MGSNGPAEVQARPGHVPGYFAFSAHDALSAPYQLPQQFLQGIRPEANALPDAPLLVFINARSGGNQGPELAQALARALGRIQVFDLSQYKPDKVLQQLWDNFKSAIAAGVPHAALFQSRLRILVAGGDGTITWVLATIKALKLSPVPAVAVMPLGTGNDLSRSFGWGMAFDYSWIQGYTNIYNTLLRIHSAKVEDLDCWGVRIHLPHAELLGTLPHCLKAAKVLAPPSPPGERVSGEGGTKKGASAKAGGLFWNYFSIGLDARAAYQFHSLREGNPGLASNRLMNQFWYTFFSCSSGWFYCPKSVGAKVLLQVLRPGSEEWVEVPIPTGVKALVILNLQSYGGGRNLWGEHEAGQTGPKALGKEPFQEPSHSDGRLEVVGLLNGFHTAAVMSSKGNLVHAKRICQASGIRMHVRAKYVRPDGQPSHAYMQLDGEPWMQDVPSSKDNEPIVVEILHQGVSKVLHNRSPEPGCMGALCGGPAPEPRGPADDPESAQGEGPGGTSMRSPNPLGSAMASMAGTVGADSEAVQVGSERASSMHSGNSWAGNTRASA